MEEIKFYRVNDQYGFFSNFSSHPIFIEKEIWNTVEHYFQASKFENNEIKVKIKNLTSPLKAAEEGRNKNNIIRLDWEDIKEQYMLKALFAKFIQHPELKKNLLSTGNKRIIENTTNDNYWGDGGDGTGKNRLGFLLMQVRSILKSMYDDIDAVYPPWIAFPELSQYDLFWRMGLGEEYLYKWSAYYNNLNHKESYISAFPPNSEWDDIYD